MKNVPNHQPDFYMEVSKNGGTAVAGWFSYANSHSSGEGLGVPWGTPIKHHRVETG